jgi:hypothetical protein
MDTEGFDLQVKDLGFNKRESISYARLLLKDWELVRVGMAKIEVRDEQKEVVWDIFT